MWNKRKWGLVLVKYCQYIHVTFICSERVCVLVELSLCLLASCSGAAVIWICLCYGFTFRQSKRKSIFISAGNGKFANTKLATRDFIESFPLLSSSVFGRFFLGNRHAINTDVGEWRKQFSKSIVSMSPTIQYLAQPAYQTNKPTTPPPPTS